MTAKDYEEIAKEMKVDVDLLVLVNNIRFSNVSLDGDRYQSDDGPSVSIVDSLEDDSVIDPNIKVEFLNIVDLMKIVLDERTFDMIYSYYISENETFDQIGRRYDVSRERVRQIINKGLEKVRDCVSSKPKNISSKQQLSTSKYVAAIYN